MGRVQRRIIDGAAARLALKVLNTRKLQYQEDEGFAVDCIGRA